MKTKLHLLAVAMLVWLPMVHAAPTPQPEAVDARKWLSANADKVKFVSHSGRIIGADNDVVMTFTKDGVVEVILHGVGVVTYQGTYTVSETGIIRLTVGGDPAWRFMRLYIDNRGPLLLPPGQKLTADLDRWGSFWPLRPEQKQSKDKPSPSP